MAPAEEIFDVQATSRRSRAASPAARKSTGDEEDDKVGKTSNEATKENIANSFVADTHESQKAVQTKVVQEFTSRLKLVVPHAKHVLEDLRYSRRSMVAVLMLLSALLVVACPSKIRSAIHIGVDLEVARTWLHKIHEVAAETSVSIYLALVGTIVVVMLVCFMIKRRRAQREALDTDAGKKAE